MREQGFETEIAVIGGGASALALAAMLEGFDVTVLERGARVGKKLLATGNGKCNLTGTGCDEYGYNRPDFVRGFLSAFSPADTVRFFLSLGLAVRESEGRVYPFSECASSVLDVLVAAAKDKGTRFVTLTEVTRVKPVSGGFLLSLERLDDKGNPLGKGELFSEKVVLATGSNATYGKDSDSLYAALGHKVRPFAASLVPLRTDRESVKGLNGVRVKCAATLCGVREEGEILFRDYGLSGISALNLSALYARGKAKKGDTVTLDFAPAYSLGEVEEFISSFGGFGAERILRGAFHSKVAERIMARAGQDASAVPDAHRLAQTLKSYSLTLQGTLDASAAQVMSGGLETEEFDSGLQSLKCKGAYAAGEALDVDGICGGYNLQWAWSSAAAVARALNAERSQANSV